MKAKEEFIDLEWQIQPKQVDFLRACGLSFLLDGGDPGPPKAKVLMYGGSVGGGKTDALIMAGLSACIAYPKCNVGYFRREYPQLEGAGGAIMRTHQLFSKLAKWNGTQRRWTFSNGSVFQFAHCKNEEDVYNYNSQQFDFLLIDESTQFTEFQLRYLLTRNRATVNYIVPFCAMATNPGGVSHGYHKKNFVNVGVPGEAVKVEVQKGHYETHIFIPARLDDNQVLEKRDPGYRHTLEGMPSDIRRALLEGDWDVFSGQYFKQFNREKHIIEPYKIMEHWRRFASIDWGYAAPCAVLWHTIDPTMGRVITYRELYVTEHRAAEVAELFLELSAGEEIAYVKGSPDMWHERGLGSKAQPGEIIAEEFLSRNINIEPADNRRIIGWQRVREYLADSPDDKPWWQVFNTCTNTIRTLPEMIHDKGKVEDVSPDGEDHCCFVAGTMVTTDKGEVAIENIGVGDKVLTREGYKPVELSGYTGNENISKLTMENGAVLYGTGNHPVWVANKGFVSIGNLNRKDELLGTEGEPVLVDTVTSAGEAGVYNLKVKDVPEYYANGILVSNCESLRYGLMSRPSPNEGSSFLSGASEHFGSLDDDDDYLDDYGTDLDITFYDL